VALVRPTRSRALVTQMIGRGTRLADGKASCLVLDFVPGRMARVRLSSPADALAGAELPTAMAEFVREVSAANGGRLDELIAGAREHAEQLALADIERQRAELAERQRLVRSVGVIYAAHRLDVAELLEAVSGGDTAQRSGQERAPATLRQVMGLRAAGLGVPETISREEASRLFTLLERRRAASLCTIKQARKLRSYGLRDDVTFAEARELLDTIAANDWQPPSHLLKDARLRPRAVGA
jgi:hypothetical protein